MTRKKANYYLYRIYRLLKSDKVSVVFKKIRSTAGKTDSETIWLNPHHDILPTLIHECLHVLYPTWSESKVLKYESQIFNQLSQRQINNLLLQLTLAIKKIN